MKTTLKILSASALLATIAPLTSCTDRTDEDFFGRSNITLASDTLTPEALWAMGRIGAYSVSPDGSKVAYQVTYYSVEENRSNTLLYVQDITAEASSTPSPSPLGLGSSPVWLSADCIAFAQRAKSGR